MALIEGTSGNNTLNGTSGNDKILGYQGDDRLFGFEGNDFLNGGRGNDTLNGGAGADIFVGMRGADVFVGGADGDTVNYSFDVKDGATTGVTINLSGQARAGLAADTARDSFGFIDSVAKIPNAIGTKFTDTIHGGGNDNKLSGLGGRDFLFGRDGNDSLNGGSGNDVLNGGAGNDVLEGGAGADTLFGEAGRDTFDFNKVTDARGDVIKDFETGLDKINLATIDANTELGDNQKFAWVNRADQDAAFVDGKAGQLRFADGILSGDVNGDGAADFQFKVVGTLNIADVIL